MLSTGRQQVQLLEPIDDGPRPQALPLSSFVRTISLSNSQLHLILLPTEQCNFRCTYCYEDFAIGKMKPEVVTGVKRLISKKAETLRSLEIDFFGGEPLLNMKAVREISQHCLDLPNPQLVYKSGMTTNGLLLTGEIFKELNELRCRSFQISLDGWGSVHDETRRRFNRRPSFDTIWGNLLAARDTDLDFSILLRVHLRPNIDASLIKLVTAIRDEFADPRFSILLKEVGKWGGADENHPVTFAESPEGRAALRAELDDLVGQREEAIVRPADDVDASYLAVPIAPDDVCYAGKANSLVIRANGRINKCTVALLNDKNDVGSIAEDGSLTILPEKLAPWLRGLETLDLSQLGCPASFALREPAVA